MATNNPLGIVQYALSIRNQWLKKTKPAESLDDPIRYLNHCHDLGFGGIQIALKIQDSDYCHRMRQRAEEWNMFVEGNSALPMEETETERFDAEVKTAVECGASVIRTVMMPGRRYEDYESLEEFKSLYQRGLRAVERAEPIAKKHNIRLAIENHKEQRIPDLLNVLEHLSSEPIGVCFDTGNSFSLLEDPLEAAKAYAKWTWTVHYKDQAVREYEDGFLFADVKYGEGFIDLKQLADIVRQGNPEARFNLEMITRDPLKVPCLAHSYWRTFPNMPARDLSRSLQVVKTHRAAVLPEISTKPLEEQATIEEDNVRSSLAYARERLGFG